MSGDTLAAMGFDDWFRTRWEALGSPGGLGRVVRLDRGWCTVLTGDGRADDEPLRVRTYGQVAVGDWVVIDADGEKVEHVLERWSAFVRRASFEGARAQAHVLAANVHTVFLVHALGVRPSERRLERELVLAYESGATPVVVLSKADLADDLAASVADVEAVTLGVAVHAVSVRTGLGVDGLRQYADGGRTVALLGSSGVGKSTLVNALIGRERQRTAEVREGDSRGRHTTVAAELISLPSGGFLVDTPGLRAVNLWSGDEDTPHGLDRAFADVLAVAEHCRFRDCRHEGEPDCAVGDALAAGTLSASRVVSWQRLSAELVALERESVEVERAAAKGRRRGRRSGRGGPAIGDEADAEGNAEDDD
jgi:ribosome biogenesis GTPase